MSPVAVTVKNSQGATLNTTAQLEPGVSVVAGRAFRLVPPQPSAAHFVVAVTSMLPGPEATFIIPAYNAEAFIGAAIDSCLAQTVENVDVIVIDDGSTDQTAQIAFERAQATGRVTLLQQANWGVSAARNRGVEHATAPVTIWLDADDLAPPDRAEISLHELDLHDADLLYGQEEEFGSNPMVLTRTHGIGLPHAACICSGCGFRTSTVAARRSLLEKHGVSLDEELAGGEDHDLLIAALSAGARVRCSDRVLLWRRRHDGNLRNGLDWPLIRGHITEKHKAFLRQYTGTPIITNPDMFKRIEAARALAREVGRAAPQGGTVQVGNAQQQPEEKLMIETIDATMDADRINEAARATDADIIVLSRLAVDEASVDVLAAALADPSVGAVGPLVRNGTNELQRKTRRSDSFVRSRVPLDATCIAVRRETLLAVGGLDARLDRGGYTDDLCARLMQAHQRLLISRSFSVEAVEQEAPSAETQALLKAKWGVAPAKVGETWQDPPVTVVIVGDDPQAAALSEAACRRASIPVEVVVVGLRGAMEWTRPAGDALLVMPAIAGGIGAAFNRGIRRGLGEIVVCLMAGDELYAEWLDGLPALLEQAEVATGKTSGVNGGSAAAIAAKRDLFTRGGLWFDIDAPDPLPMFLAAVKAEGQTVKVSKRLAASVPLRLGNAVCRMRPGKPVVFLAGCGFSVTGGGQRPTQLSVALAERGPSIHLHEEEDPHIQHGVVLGSQQRHASALAESLRGTQGAVIYGLENYRERAEEFRGWPKVFDYCDDWEEFWKANHLPYFSQKGFERAMKEADLISCSAASLEERAKELGAKHTIISRNGGPPVPFARTLESDPPGFLRGDLNVIFLGSLWGVWIDWRAFEQLARDLQDAGGVINIVGSRYNNKIPIMDNVVWHDEIPLQYAMEYVAASDVGIVPFCRHEICHAVDPVKLYDYIAGGCRVVATDVMDELKKREYCYVTKPEEMIGGVLKAAKAGKLAEAEVAKFCAANSWRVRAQTILDAVEALR